LDAPFGVGSLVDADIWCHGRVSTLDFQGRGEWDQDGTDLSLGLPDQFAAEDHRGFDFREDQMRVSEDGIPNKALDRTAMSAVFSVFADSWLAAALMAVGQLARYAA